MSNEHPTPWEIRWTRFGESIGYDSRSAIYDANGNEVVTIGNGDSYRLELAEQTARQIVSAVNPKGPLPELVSNTRMAETLRSKEPNPIREGKRLNEAHPGTISEQVRKAVSEVNRLVGAAIDQGIRVELDVSTITTTKLKTGINQDRPTLSGKLWRPL